MVCSITSVLDTIFRASKLLELTGVLGLFIFVNLFQEISNMR